jgi:hypothetical protein
MSEQKAGRYTELLKSNVDQLWKRREIEWRIHFSLWLAIGGVTVFACTQLSPATLHRVTLWVGLTYFIAILLYAWHSLGLFVSNEKDLAWIRYFQAKAREMLGEAAQAPACPTELDEKATSGADGTQSGWRKVWPVRLVLRNVTYQLTYIREGKLEHKIHAVVPHLFLTGALMVASVWFMASIDDPGRRSHDKPDSKGGRVGKLTAVEQPGGAGTTSESKVPAGQESFRSDSNGSETLVQNR